MTYPLIPGMTGCAVFDASGTRRFRLTRHWKAGGPSALWIGMNPSRAGSDVDDPTVRREVLYTRDVLGMARYVKCNVMDAITVYPAELLKMTAPSAPENLAHIAAVASDADIVIACWGTLPPRLRAHSDAVASMLQSAGIAMHCRGTTADGSPRHGRGVGNDVPVTPWP